ncbi:uncharacterized protein LOC143462833 [Clavelina lepadiformis]|uniref:uncharacterized protein LOC143462833 n=1 Tax=Clavelina lepadiformis TaxID=159417 RepID=UPI0040423BD8
MASSTSTSENAAAQSATTPFYTTALQTFPMTTSQATILATHPSTRYLTSSETSTSSSITETATPGTSAKTTYETSSIKVLSTPKSPNFSTMTRLTSTDRPTVTSETSSIFSVVSSSPTVPAGNTTPSQNTKNGKLTSVTTTSLNGDKIRVASKKLLIRGLTQGGLIGITVVTIVFFSVIIAVIFKLTKRKRHFQEPENFGNPISFPQIVYDDDTI